MNYLISRRAMIDSQLRTSGINEAFVLERMGTVPREDFVPDGVKSIAYMDRTLPLGDGRFLASPVAHGRMLAEAAPKSTDRALVIESGTGYLAELLRPLVASVDTLDASELARGKPKLKDFDLVLVDGALGDVPKSLVKTLAENGRVVSGIIDGDIPRLAVGRRTGDRIAFDMVDDTALPALPMFAQAKEWSF